MKTFISLMQYLREEMVHEGLFVGKPHTKMDKRYIRRALRQLY